MNLFSDAQSKNICFVGREKIIPAPDTRLRVGMLFSCWCCGGMERYHLALAKWTKRIKWVGCALAANATVLIDQVAELAAVMPVHGDLKLRADGGDAVKNVTTHSDEQSAIDAVSSQADVMFVWGVQDLSGRLDNFKGPIVLISHGECPWTRATLLGASIHATHFAAVSEPAATVFPDAVKQQVMTVGIGVEVDRVAPSRAKDTILRELNLPAGKKRVGFVGRFSAEKHPIMAAKIVGQMENAVAIYHGNGLYGEGDFKKEATEAAKGNIIFLDRTWHLGDVLSILDCMVIASDNEGGPLVAIEAWMAGVPIVCTRVGLMARNPEWCTFRSLQDSVEDWVAGATEAMARPFDVAISRTALERYSAASLGRRWQDWLYQIAEK